jgi:DNA invertase Pin-like site-specific DNA recombinase
MLIGYARVSTQDQNLDLQKDALKAVGCKEIYEDTASGADFKREGLTEALKYLREGDTLVVWKLDRLGRSLKQLIETVNALSAKGVGFQSLQEHIDTTTSGGKLIFHIFASLAEFERDIIKERTKAGLSAARARGRLGGRPRSMDQKKIDMAKDLLKDRNRPIKEICEVLGISKGTLYRYLPASEMKTLITKPEMTVALYLQVYGQNNSTRGVKKAREIIEIIHLSQYKMKKKERWEYELTIPYTNDEDLDNTINILLSRIHSTAEGNGCFVDMSVSSIDGTRSWE